MKKLDCDSPKNALLVCPHESFPTHIRLEADLYATAEGLTALGYTPEEDPNWDKDFGAVGAILIGENGELLAAPIRANRQRKS